MTAPALLRALVLALLAAALALPSLWGGARHRPSVVWIEGDGRGLDRTADTLVSTAPPFVARTSAAPPSEAELELLAAAAARSRLFAALPEDAAGIDAEPPARALAGRAAAVPFRLRAAPGDTVTVRLRDGTGVLDSVRVEADAAGTASAAFRVRPPRAGWREWTVEANGATARTGAWADSAGPPRVLVKAGFPSWESKFVVRALEESGAAVETALDLGRGLAVAQGAGAAITPARLAAFDAVIVLDGAPLGGGERAALAEWAANGGGVLAQGDRAGALGTARPADALAIDGAALRWTLPPELAPLPGDRVRAAAAPLRETGAGTALVASAPEGGVLALRPQGRGRAAALAITETWRWRMEAGRLDEHREFWRALVDWLASAPRGALTVSLPEPLGPVGARREARVFDASGDTSAAAPRLVVSRPGGGADTLPLTRDRDDPRVLRGAFVPAAPGVHAFALAGARPTAGFAAVAASADSAGGGAADAWARLSLLASRSGGRAVPADSLRPLVRRLSADPGGGGWRGPGPWLVFALLLALASAEWAVRRLTGRA